MPYSSARHDYQSGTSGGTSYPLRKWLAIFLALLAAAAAYVVFSRDDSWEQRSHTARLLGSVAEDNGHYDEARRHYEDALRDHPYDWAAHFALASLLSRHLNDQDGAIRHYLQALAYTPDPSSAAEAEEEIQVLMLIRAGELENPADALDDMFRTVESGAEAAFRRRLSIGLGTDHAVYWNAWKQRGRGKTVSSSVRSRKDGFYEAVMEVDFPGGVSMSMHFHCPAKDIWRMDLSFP